MANKHQSLSSETGSLQSGDCFAKRYKVQNMLSFGNFGKIYEVEDKHTHKRYALKVEYANKEDSLMKAEAEIMMSFLGHHKHFPRLITTGHTSSRNYIVMTLLGPNIEDLIRKRPNKKFTLETAVRVGYQCFEALRDLHTLGYLHRDVNPGNLLIGLGHYRHLIYLIDFSLARKFMKADKSLATQKGEVIFRCTLNYASISVHDHLEQGPQDDLISMMYTMVFMLNGSLPWTKDTNQRVVKLKKKQITATDLFIGFPQQMKDMYKNLIKHAYPAIIDYNAFDNKFIDMMMDIEIDVCQPFEWEQRRAHKIKNKR